MNGNNSQKCNKCSRAPCQCYVENTCGYCRNSARNCSCTNQSSGRLCVHDVDADGCNTCSRRINDDEWATGHRLLTNLCCCLNKFNSLSLIFISTSLYLRPNLGCLPCPVGCLITFPVLPATSALANFLWGVSDKDRTYSCSRSS